MSHFEVTEMWNYTAGQYQSALIERSFTRGTAHITIHRWL